MATPQAGAQATAALMSGGRQGRGWRDATVLQAALGQPALMAAILAATEIFAHAGAGGMIARLVFIAAAVAAAAFYIRRSPWEYITLTLWFWTLTPFARRLVDYHAGFDPVNFMLVTPNLLTLFMARDVLSSRGLLRLREAVIGLFLLGPVVYSLTLSFMLGLVVPGIVAAADWFGPLLYYFYILLNWRRIPQAEPIFKAFLAANGLVIVAYGLYQYLYTPPWDAAWVLDSGMTSSIGHPVPHEIRVFGTLNAPGILAFWVGAELLLTLHFRGRLSFLVLPAGAVVLALTLVRSIAGTVVMGVLLAGLLGRASMSKVVGITLVATVIVLAGLSAVDPEMAEHIGKRFSTLNSLSTDNSALAREDMYRRAPGTIAAHPLGLGIGAVGRGAVAGDNTEYAIVDSGILVIYISMGWFAGSIYLAGIGLVLAQALMAGRSTGSSAAMAMAITATATAANVFFTTITGFFAATIWICCAYAAAVGIYAREAARARTLR